jgi:AcrR family transcriptional regulator
MPSVTRKPQSSRAARREAIRDRLLEVVQRLLDEGESFTEISVERMVQAAGMSRSTFYVYFEDKGDLLRAWFGGIEAEIADAVVGWWEIDADSTREDLREALANVVEVYLPHAPLMAATYDAAAYDPSIRELVVAMMGANIASLRKHIRKGQAAGFIDPGLPAAETAQWLTWMAERAFHVFLRGLTPAQLRTQLDAYTAIVWNTLYAPTRAALSAP